jgi:hypothetical protein
MQVKTMALLSAVGIAVAMLPGLSFAQSSPKVKPMGHTQFIQTQTGTASAGPFMGMKGAAITSAAISGFSGVARVKRNPASDRGN